MNGLPTGSEASLGFKDQAECLYGLCECVLQSLGFSSSVLTIFLSFQMAIATNNSTCVGHLPISSLAHLLKPKVALG
jgi:hypothetical protein